MLLDSFSMFTQFSKVYHLTNIIVDFFSVQPKPGVRYNLNIICNGNFSYSNTRSQVQFFARETKIYSYTGSNGKANDASTCISSKYWYEELDNEKTDLA